MPGPSTAPRCGCAGRAWSGPFGSPRSHVGCGDDIWETHPDLRSSSSADASGAADGRRSAGQRRAPTYPPPDPAVSWYDPLARRRKSGEVDTVVRYPGAFVFTAVFVKAPRLLPDSLADSPVYLSAPVLPA